MTTPRRSHASTLVHQDAIVDALRDAGHTVGRTRRAILGAVHAKQGAFTAEDLSSELHDVHPSTVYRSLALLEEIGVVTHVHLAHGPALYERTSAAGEMRHLVCEECGRHLSVPAGVFDQARRTLLRDYDFELDGTHFAFSGRCRECATRTRGST